MSKTMDNDWDEHVSEVLTPRAEIERLKDIIKISEQAYTELGAHMQGEIDAAFAEGRFAQINADTKERDSLRADNERLKAVIADGLKYSSEVDTNNTILRARVEELEAKNYDLERTAILYLANEAQSDQIIWDTEKERDELRTRLAEVTKSRDYLKGCAVTDAEIIYQREKTIEELESRLASYEKPAPTIVKQTWARVNLNKRGNLVEGGECSTPATSGNMGYTLLGHIRRDHYSDGTVVATLETINQETEK